MLRPRTGPPDQIDVVGDALLSDRDALGRAGAARGVDEVGGVMRRSGVARSASAGAERAGRRAGCRAPGRRGSRQTRWSCPGAAGERLQARQDAPGSCILEHEGEPLGGIVGIEGQVGGAGLEGGQDGQDHLE